MVYDLALLVGSLHHTGTQARIMSTGPGIPRQGILSLSIKDKGALYQAMPSSWGGGILCLPKPPYGIGDEVFILLSLMEEKDRMPVAGKVVRVTPNAPRATQHGHRTSQSPERRSHQDRDHASGTLSPSAPPIRWMNYAWRLSATHCADTAIEPFDPGRMGRDCAYTKIRRRSDHTIGHMPPKFCFVPAAMRVPERLYDQMLDSDSNY